MAEPCEDGVRASGGSELLLGAGTLYSVYLRGAAYLAEHDGRNAAAEFQKILDHRGILMSDPIGAWRICNSVGLMRSAPPRTKPAQLIAIFLVFGKMPTLAYQSSSAPGRNLQTFNSRAKPFTLAFNMSVPICNRASSAASTERMSHASLSTLRSGAFGCHEVGGCA